jgi:hypothetical protein
MRATFKCENCLKETIIGGEGRRHLGCQECGCGDIKFDSDVTLSPVSNINPGDVHPSILVKKGESFLGNHSLGSSWILTFPIPEVVVVEPLKLRKKV